MIIWFHISWNNAIVCALQGEKSRSRIRRKWGEKANAKHTKYNLFDFAHEMSAIIFVYENTIYKIISNHFFLNWNRKRKRYLGQFRFQACFALLASHLLLLLLSRLLLFHCLFHRNAHMWAQHTHRMYQSYQYPLHTEVLCASDCETVCISTALN